MRRESDDVRVVALGGHDEEGTHDSSESCLSGDTAFEPFEPGPSLSTARWGFAAVPLEGRKVLLIGGTDGYDDLRSTEIVDLGLNARVQGPSMRIARSGCCAVRLDEKRVLVVGGFAQDSTEMLDLERMEFFHGPRLTSIRACASALMLDKYRVMVVGGFSNEGCLDSSETAPITKAFRPDAGHFDLERVTFSPGPRLAQRRGAAALADLDDGTMILIGGSDGVSRLRSCEVLNVVEMRFSTGPELNAPRSGAAAVQLDKKNLLVLGGLGAGAVGSLATTEVLQPDDEGNLSFSPGPVMQDRRAYCAAVIDIVHGEEDEI